MLLLAIPASAATISLTLSYLVQNPFTRYWKIGWAGEIQTSDPQHKPVNPVTLFEHQIGSGSGYSSIDTADINTGGAYPNWSYGVEDSGQFRPLNVFEYKAGVNIVDKDTGAYITTVYSSAHTF